MWGHLTLLRATIEGMGCSGPCELLARKQRVEGRDGYGSQRFTYAELTILKTPESLPNGAYIITTEDGFTVAATKQRSLWLMGTPRRREREGELREA